MEPVVCELQGLDIGSSSLLGLPDPCPWDSDDEPLCTGRIKPKSSPIPTRRSSLSCSDDDSQPPPSSSRRVSFADAFGLSLVSVKQFDTWSMCDPTDPLEVDLKGAKEYILKLLFALPLTLEELIYRVQEQKVELESLELFPGTTTLKGTVRVLNLCFDKLVYVRTSLDCWSSHFDLLAEYMPESSDGFTDCFSFKLTLVPPFGEQGARVDFCIRYETPMGTFWANNCGQNYILFCHEKAKVQDENEKPKSCLKPSRHSPMTSTTSNTEEIPAAVTEPVSVNEEKVQEDHIKLKAENSRNGSRRCRRKASRMVKLQQRVAQRDEKDLRQTEKDTDEVNSTVPAIDEETLNLSALQINVASLLDESRNTDGLKITAGCTDVDRKQFPATYSQTPERDNITLIQPELITSKSQIIRPPVDSVNTSMVDSQLLESGQDEETVSSPTVLFKSQASDKSDGKIVEKAWECFEKSAMERLDSTADTNTNRGKINHVDNALLENNQDSQAFPHHYTFEILVAPLYQQAFERMKNDKRGVKDSASKADKSVGKLDDGSLRVVTYPSAETRSNPEISAEHVCDHDYHGACKETFPEYLHNIKSTIENPLSVPNVKTKCVATKFTFQEPALPDLSDNRLYANILESEAARAVTPIQKQLSANSLSSVNWEKCTIDQTEQTPEIIILQRQHSDDTEFTLANKPVCSGYSLNTFQKELMYRDGAISPTQSETDITAAKPSTVIMSEKPPSKDRSVTQASFETQINNEVRKTEEGQTSDRTLNTHIKCLEGSYTPIPDSTLFSSDISSNVTAKIIQSEASSPSQALTPATIVFTQNPEVTGADSQQQTTSDTDMIEKTTNMCQNSDDSHRGTQTESNPSDRNDGVGSWEETGNDTKNIHTETIHTSLEETAGGRVSETFTDFSQINKYEETRILPLDFPEEINGFDEYKVDKHIATSNISSSPEKAEHASEEEAEDDVKGNLSVKNPGKNEEKELTDMTENQSEDVMEIREEEEEQEEDKTDDQIEKEEQDSDKQIEVIWENDLKAEIEDQKMVTGVMSVAMQQSIPNVYSIVGEVHMNMGQERQNADFDQMSEEPVSERSFTAEGEYIFYGTNASQETLTLNSDVAFSDRFELIDRKEDVCHQIDKEHLAEDGIDATQARDCLNVQSESMDDSASTESLTDDEMEMCLLRLKSSQKSGLKDGKALGQRHSINRTRTIPLLMPSISENMDEDKMNALMRDLTNEQMIEIERAALPLADKEEDVTELNLLWWREFFSYDNMPKMIVYTLLFVVFLITSYICDFVACFGLYLLAIYWLYFQVQREPLKGT